MRVEFLKYQIFLDSKTILECPSSDEIQSTFDTKKIPSGVYKITAPFIGSFLMSSGCFVPSKQELSELLHILVNKIKSEDDLKKYADQIKQFIQNDYIADNIIFQFYYHVKINKNKEFEKYKFMFNFLLQQGARINVFESEENKKEAREFYKEMSQLFPDLPTQKIAEAALNDDFKKKIEIFLPLGGNLNCLKSNSPFCGTHLHVYLANELSNACDLIDFFESKRDPNKKNTQYDYSQQDEEGKTPLLIAIMTRQTKVIKKLLELAKLKQLDIGINIPDKNGRTPLMFATMLGLTDIIEELMMLGVDAKKKDREEKCFLDYLEFDDEKIKQIMLPILQVDRGEAANHSYLYGNDKLKSPLCLYEDNELSASGEDQKKHFVLLSPLPEHQKRINQVLTCKIAPNHFDLKFIKQQVGFMGSITFLQVCKQEQKKVKEYLLRRACAIGDVNRVEFLLKQNVDPNQTDEYQRTALHYTVMRSELIKGFFPQGTDETIITQSLSNHGQVLDLLLKYPKIDVHAKNQNNNTAWNILQRDAESKNKLDAEIAKQLLEKMLNMNSKFKLK